MLNVSLYPFFVDTYAAEEAARRGHTTFSFQYAVRNGEADWLFRFPMTEAMLYGGTMDITLWM
jgi:hypothetical protein